mmetsp:Transcript_89848/g.290802  ORF Transcript_89848/g.290802 Transcript_89848/m.290802 type:complete len:206 (+) Transcript_89848:1054-1671(+)
MGACVGMPQAAGCLEVCWRDLYLANNCCASNCCHRVPECLACEATVGAGLRTGPHIGEPGAGAVTRDAAGVPPLRACMAPYERARRGTQARASVQWAVAWQLPAGAGGPRRVPRCGVLGRLPSGRGRCGEHRAARAGAGTHRLEPGIATAPGPNTCRAWWRYHLLGRAAFDLWRDGGQGDGVCQEEALSLSGSAAADAAEAIPLG